MLQSTNDMHDRQCQTPGMKQGISNIKGPSITCAQQSERYERCHARAVIISSAS